MVISYKMVTYSSGFSNGWKIQVSPMRVSEEVLTEEEVKFLSAVHQDSVANGGAASVSEVEQKTGINHGQAVPIIEKLLGLGYVNYGGLGALAITVAGANAVPKQEEPPAGNT